MKKKIFMLFIAVAAAAMPCSAGYFLTSCGKGGMCLDREAFTTDEDFHEYLRDLNEAFCGTRDTPVFYSKTLQPINPNPDPFPGARD